MSETLETSAKKAVRGYLDQLIGSRSTSENLCAVESVEGYVGGLAREVDSLNDEISKLKSQLEEARARIKEWEANADAIDAARSRFHELEWDKKSPAVLEARRKAIEEAAQVAECHTGMNASGNMEYGPNMPKLIAFDIRALLSAPTEARSVLEASSKGGTE